MKPGPTKRILQGAMRMLGPFIDAGSLTKAAHAATALPEFFSSLVKYRAASNEHVELADLHPCLDDRDAPAGEASGHYFFQDLWAARKIFEAKRAWHVDVGSRVDGFVAHCASFTEILYLDLRPLRVAIPSLHAAQASLLQLPFRDRSIASLSCLHVVEHVGLGRYGDALDPNGSLKAIAELQRVLAPGGDLYFGIPCGRERVCFNAHRVFDPRTIVAAFSQLQLASFAAVDDSGKLVAQADLAEVAKADYACGLFHFSRK